MAVTRSTTREANKPRRSSRHHTESWKHVTSTQRPKPQKSHRKRSSSGNSRTHRKRAKANSPFSNHVLGYAEDEVEALEDLRAHVKDETNDGLKVELEETKGLVGWSSNFPTEVLIDASLFPFDGQDKNTGYTFGVEMEVIAILPLEDMIARIPKEIRRKYSEAELHTLLERVTEAGGLDYITREAVYDVLTAAGFPVNQVRVKDESIQRWSVEPEPQIMTHFEKKAHPDAVVVGVEIKSGALDFTASSLAHVAAGMKAVNDAFWITTNTSCGLHVHIGAMRLSTGRQQSIPFKACQHLLIEHVLFEDQIERMHPRHVMTGKDWPQSLRNRFRQQHSRGVVEAAKHVLEAKNFQDLLKLVSKDPDHDRNLSINFTNMARSVGLNTIEFRQHEGTFDVETVLRRVQLCVLFTHWAACVDQEVILNQIEAVSNRFKIDIIELLKQWNLQPQSIEHIEHKILDIAIRQSISKNRALTPCKSPNHTCPRSRDMLAEEAKPLFPQSSSIQGHVATSRPMFAIVGTGLVLNKETGDCQVRYKIIDKRNNPRTAFASWATEAGARALVRLTKDEVRLLGRLRARRWIGKRPESIVKRWKSMKLTKAR